MSLKVCASSIVIEQVAATAKCTYAPMHTPVNAPAISLHYAHARIVPSFRVRSRCSAAKYARPNVSINCCAWVASQADCFNVVWIAEHSLSAHHALAMLLKSGWLLATASNEAFDGNSS